MISFHNQDVNFTVKNKGRIRTWITETVRKKKRRCGDINFIFCSDQHLLGMNQQYLDHNTYTDIITFDYSEDTPGRHVSGDIFISVERVKENAAKFGKTAENEMQRVMIHGVLHLLGYKDKGKAAKEEMTAEEDKALKLLSRLSG